MTQTSDVTESLLATRLATLRRVGGDAVVGKMLGLPRASTRYTVNRVEVPMRDGVKLVADHYAPTTSSPVGTLLIRGPYGRGFPFSLAYARLYAARGYHVLFQSVRGTFGSGGAFEPMVNEAADAADTVEWLRQQSWFTGRFATVGLSYLGFTQWALLQDPPPELAAAVITVAPHDFQASVWGTGTFTINDFLGWSDLVARQEEPGRLRQGIRQLTAQRKVTRALTGVPIGPSVRELLGAGAPWFESWVEHVDAADPFWDRLRFPAALDRVQVPVLLLGGWQDIFLDQTLQQYRHLRGRNVDVALTIGPWTHTQMLTKGLAVCAQESLDWLNAHVAGATLQREGRVHVFVNHDGWRKLSDWPPTTTDHSLYLQPAGHLSETAAAGGAPPATFRYDPAHPTPTTGGPLLSPSGGYSDDTRLAERDDVLSFTSATLAHDLFAYGNPVIELEHTSDNSHVDLFVRVSEVDDEGRSRNVSDGYQRLSGAKEAVSIELDGIAHRFEAGSRIRVLITGSWFPRYARSFGAGEPTLTAAQLKPAVHSVHFGRSRLVLPAGKPLPDGVTDVGNKHA